MTAARYGRSESVSILMAHGAEVNTASKVIQNWLYAGWKRYVVFHNRLFLFQLQGGWTAVHMAAQNEYEDCISILVANGADVNVAAKKVQCVMFNVLWRFVSNLSMHICLYVE